MSLKPPELASLGLCALLVGLSSVALAKATELDLKAAVGYDSNVFRLNDDLVDAEGGMFADIDADFSANAAVGSQWTLGADLDAAARLYESSVNDGNESQYRLRMRGERKPATPQGASFEWELSHTLRDATYVSRSTGKVAESGGVKIGDRFDSGKSELVVRMDQPFTGHLHGLLDAHVEEKDYRKDYENLGLNRLDYLAYGLTPGIAYRTKTQELKVTLPMSLRRYRDRRANDSTGVEIAGSDLEYRYLGVDTRYEYELTSVYTLWAAASYEERSDNEDGFDDSNTAEVSLGWVAKPQKRTRYGLEVRWSDRHYDRLNVAAQQLGEEAPEREGYSFIAKYSRLMPGLEAQDVRLFAEGRVDSYENDSDKVFSYDRHQALIGLRKDF